MMKLIAWLMAGALLTGCAPLGGPAVPSLTDGLLPAQHPVSDQYRGADWDFALELAKRTLNTAEENPVVSPLSAWLALSMAANGAAGDTEQAFAQVMGQAVDVLNAANLGRTASLLDTQGQTAISIANSIWLDESFTPRQDFLQRMVDYYAAQVYGMELSTQEAMEAMNQWISAETKGMIPNMFSQPLSEDTAAVLINTVYMKAKWRSPFGSETIQRPFTLANGDRTEAEFMYQKARFPYAHKDGVQAIQLPYDDGRLSFFALLPEEGASATDLLARLDQKLLKDYFAEADEMKVALNMPKFTVEHAVTMNDALKAMGLENAFAPGTADFGPMGSVERNSLYISSVLQKVKVIVDEDGTEAAAATVISVGTTSMPVAEELIYLTLDRPFVYAIADQVTGAILFAGVLTNPNQ